MGYFLKSAILRIDSVFFLPLNNHISGSAAENNSKYLAMIRECVNQKALYFSKEFDITFNVQTLLQNVSKDKIAASSDERYFFNKVHAQCFIEWGMADVIVPVMYGFFAVRIFSRPILDAPFHDRKD